jgi:hypothetical protein
LSELLTKARYRPTDRHLFVPILTDRLTRHTAFSIRQTFRNRLVEVIDQAQHFAALGPAMTGAGGQSGDAALMFREGLEVTERERGCFSIMLSSSDAGVLTPDKPKKQTKKYFC